MSQAAVEPTHEAEYAFLQKLRSRYEEEGYDFLVHPSKSDLPSFLAAYRPDAIARKGSRNIAIEVKSRGSDREQDSLQSIRKLFEGRPDWQFTVAYSGAESARASLPVLGKESILSRFREVEELAASGHARPAFILAWSLLEAALNTAEPLADKRPRTPGTVVQTLAMQGHISPEIESRLRELIQFRNQIVHGDLTIEPSQADVGVVLSAVAATLGEMADVKLI